MIRHPALIGFLAGVGLHLLLIASNFVLPLYSFMNGIFRYFGLSYDWLYIGGAPPMILLEGGFLKNFPASALVSTTLMTGSLYSILFWSVHKVAWIHARSATRLSS
jgi:hypothetical protein